MIPIRLSRYYKSVVRCFISTTHHNVIKWLSCIRCHAVSVSCSTDCFFSRYALHLTVTVWWYWYDCHAIIKVWCGVASAPHTIKRSLTLHIRVTTGVVCVSDSFTDSTHSSNHRRGDRKSVVEGTSVDLGGRRIINKITTGRLCDTPN